MSLVDPNFPDGGNSFKMNNPVNKITSSDQARNILTVNNNNLDQLYHAHGIFDPKNIDYFGKRYRNGILNPYQTVSRVREYLFFTKPDLNILAQDITGKVKGGCKASNLFSTLQDIPFWQVLVDKYPEVIGCLHQQIINLIIY